MSLQMASWHMKRCSALLIIRKMKSRTRGATSHQSENPQITSAGEGMEKKGALLHCWWECKLL